MRVCDLCGTSNLPIVQVRYRLFDPEVASRTPNSDLDAEGWDLCDKCKKSMKTVLRSAITAYTEERAKERKS